MHPHVLHSLAHRYNTDVYTWFLIQERGWMESRGRGGGHCAVKGRRNKSEIRGEVDPWIEKNGRIVGYNEPGERSMLYMK